MLEDRRKNLATEATVAIAQLENESALRCETANPLDIKITRLRRAVETAHRRIMDLTQSAVTAKAVQVEQRMQSRRAPGTENRFEDAEAPIARVMGREASFQQGEILHDINAAVKHGDIGDRRGEGGYDPATKPTAADVLPV